MTDISDLQETFRDHETLAPDGVGLIAAATARATEIRRYRRRGLLIGVAVVVAVLVTIPSMATGRLGPHRTVPATHSSAASPPYRQPLQLTVDLASGTEFFNLEYGVVGATQYMNVRSKASSEMWQVEVHDPGAFDPATYLRGQAITFGGVTAYFVPDYPRTGTGPVPGHLSSPQSYTVKQPRLGWRDASGAWVDICDESVGTSAGRATQQRLVALATAVRLHAQSALTAPYHLGYVPNGLRGVYGLVSDHDLTMTNSIVGLDTSTSGLIWDRISPLTALLLTSALNIQVLPRGDYVDSHTRDLAPTDQIAGHDVWYLTATSFLVVPDGGSAMAVNAGNCQAHFVVRDRTRIPYAELKRIVEGATFLDCTNPTTWTAPLP